VRGRVQAQVSARRAGGNLARCRGCLDPAQGQRGLGLGSLQPTRAFLPAIWLSDGVLRFKPSKITEFIEERERLSTKRRRRR